MENPTIRQISESKPNQHFSSTNINNLLNTLEDEDFDKAISYIMFLSDNRKKERTKNTESLLKDDINLKPLSEEEILQKLEKSRKHADEGNYKNADSVINDMRAKYGL